jgi:hypothetical protein
LLKETKIWYSMLNLHEFETLWEGNNT